MGDCRGRVRMRLKEHLALEKDREQRAAAKSAAALFCCRVAVADSLQASDLDRALWDLAATEPCDLRRGRVTNRCR